VAEDMAHASDSVPADGTSPRADARPASHTSADRLLLVTELARQVTARHDLDDVLQATLAALRRLVVFGGGSIQLLDDDGWIRLAAGDPAPPDDVRAFRIPLESSIGGRVILTEHPVYLSDVDVESSDGDDSSKTPFRARVSPGGVRSYFGVPLLADGQAIGLIQVDSAEPDAWDEEDRLLLISVAPIVAAAIQNARAYARVAGLLADRRRESERHALVAHMVDTDIDSSLSALVALSEDLPLVREQVDRLTIAVGRIRGALDDASGGGPTPSPEQSVRQRGDGGDIDLRVDDKTLT
jgi:GAF domain-containing protein